MVSLNDASPASTAANTPFNSPNVMATKKSKSKPKSSAQSPIQKLLVEKYASMLPDPISLTFSAAKKTHAVATRNIAAGEAVFAEKPLICSMTVNSAAEYCQACFKSFPADKSGVKAVECTGKCGFVAYCSSECKKKDEICHDMECSVLKNEEFRKSLDSLQVMQFEHVRMLCRIIAISLQEQQQSESANDSMFKHQLNRAHYQMFMDLPFQISWFEKEWNKKNTAAAKTVYEFLPKEINDAVTIADLAELNARMQTYFGELHPLYDVQVYSPMAFGVFPFTSLFMTHSCLANCHFHSAAGGVQVIRALKDIKKGEELSVSLAELYSSREDRWSDLSKLHRGSKCNCPRCRVELKNSNDRFLVGMMCKKCGKDVYLPVYEKNPVGVKVEKEEEKKPDTDGVNDESDKPPKPETSTFFPSMNIKNCKQLQCVNTQCNATIEIEKYLDIESTILTNYSLPTVFFQQQDFASACRYYTEFLAGSGKLLPFVHMYLFQSRIYQMHASSAVEDHMLVIKATKEVIETVEKAGILPQYHPDWAELYFNLGSVMSKTAKDRSIQATKAEAIIVKKLNREAKEWFKKSYEQRKVCYGAEHPKTKAVETFC